MTVANLEAERKRAAARGEAYAQPYNAIPTWDAGAPVPHLLSSGRNITLVYYGRANDPTWDGTWAHVRDLSDLAPVVVLDFLGCAIFKMGSPNDEVLHGHPLFGKGLDFYAPQIVENSPWLRELETINRVHARFDADHWRSMHHFILPFHDETFECIARGTQARVQRASLAETVRVAMDGILREM
ncbi:hypothetical protein LZC95_49495 [Pendulispora brunnea]|uniref:Uncharacterized protein n=1 Tax=Pendulispora brunnea TaxID=2905690 RepID=A0ABZ2K709_9BACT